MGGRFIWIVIALLAGAALFGILKSIELLKENDRLSHSVIFLTTELEVAKKEIREVKSDLGESRLINAQLEDDTSALKGKLVKAELKISQFQQYAVLLKKKYGEVLVMTKSLDERNRQMSERFLRLNLENQEFRMKLSSEKGLKEAIGELKKLKRKSRSRVPRFQIPKKKFMVLPPHPELKSKPATAPGAGNQGFLIKDGRSTIEQLVDIRVEPVSFPDESIRGE